MTDQYQSELSQTTERQAHWRQEKAEQHPDDNRNLKAAKLMACNRLNRCERDAIAAAAVEIEIRLLTDVIFCAPNWTKRKGHEGRGSHCRHRR